MAAASDMKRKKLTFLIILVPIIWFCFFSREVLAGCEGTASWETPVACNASDQSYNSCNSARDGTFTYWTTNCTYPPQWIYFDLGAIKCISKVQMVISDVPAPETMDIQVSNDASSWVTVVSGWTISIDGTWVSKIFSETTRRYVRVYITGLSDTEGYCPGTQGYASISEFQAYTRPYSLITVPTVTTETATIDVQNNQATLKGNVTATGGQNADQRGFEWGLSSGSYTAGSWIEGTSGNYQYGTGAFSYNLTGLSSGSIYYYRSRVHNSAGWGYGTEKRVVIYTADGGPGQFKTHQCDSDADCSADGNINSCQYADNYCDTGTYLCSSRTVTCGAGQAAKGGTSCTAVSASNYCDYSCDGSCRIGYRGCSNSGSTCEATFRTYGNCPSGTACSGTACASTNYCSANQCRDGGGWHHKCSKWCDSSNGCNNWADATCIDHCANGAKDCDETGTDCGGSCLSCDATPPTTAIKIKRKSTGEDLTAAGFWLRVDTYTIKFEDYDQSNGSGLNCESCSCEYSVYSCNAGGTNCNTPVISLTGRTPNSSFDISAGKTTPTYNLEGMGRYLIYSGTKDRANNPSATEYRYVNFDFTPPSAEIK